VATPDTRSVAEGRPSHAHGTPLCQDAVGSGVLGCVLDGLGCGLSEELVWGCKPVALESESLPLLPTRVRPRSTEVVADRVVEHGAVDDVG
jgi:hypothetical protein